MSDLRRSGRRAFVPCVDGRAQLESRLLLSGAKATVAAKSVGQIHYQTAFGGKIALIKDVDGELWSVVVVGVGYVRAKPMSGGRAKLIVESTNSESVLAVNPSPRNILRGSAHTYPTNARKGDHLLHIGDIKVTSGRINQILAYRTADLSGRLTALSDSPVDRIAFYSYKPGTFIRTGGDLNTFNSFTNVNLAGAGGGIFVGRDLNWMNVGGNVTIGSGTSITVARDIGLTAQAAKGSDPGGRGALITGNLDVQPGGAFNVGGSVLGSFVVDGSVTGEERISFIPK